MKGTMPAYFETIVLILLALWVFILSIILWRVMAHYNNLTKGLLDKTLGSVMDTLLSDAKLTQKQIDMLQKRCDTIEKDGFFHIQRIGLVRFNPFKDTGGDQSFILALLDGKSTGVVISGLYSRAGTRWYAKKVFEGKGVGHHLSHEEKNAIAQAIATSDMVE